MTVNPIGSAKWLVAGVVSIWVSIPVATQTLLILVLIDWITGAARAALAGVWTAREGRDGLVRKAVMVLLVVMSGLLTQPLHLAFDFGATIAVAFSINEAGSVLENAAGMGVPIPAVLLDMIRKAKYLTTGKRTVREFRKDEGDRR